MEFGRVLLVVTDDIDIFSRSIDLHSLVVESVLLEMGYSDRDGQVVRLSWDVLVEKHLLDELFMGVDPDLSEHSAVLFALDTHEHLIQPIAYTIHLVLHSLAIKDNVNFFFFLPADHPYDSRTFPLLFKFEHQISRLSFFGIDDVLALIEDLLVEEVTTSCPHGLLGVVGRQQVWNVTIVA